MRIFRKILYPVDFDSRSIGALALARELAHQKSAVICLFHVVPMPPGGPEKGVSYRTLESDAAKKLARLARRGSGRKIRYEVQVRTGQPAVEIVRAVDTFDADLVVMATHGRTGLKRLLLDSVAERVARDATCPVLIVRPRADRPAQRKSKR